MQEYDSTPNTSYPYYPQSYPPFDQFNQMEFNAQNNSPFKSPDTYNYGYSGQYDEQYYAKPSAEEFKSSEVDLGYNYDSHSNNIFEAFDRQEKNNI